MVEDKLEIERIRAALEAADAALASALDARAEAVSAFARLRAGSPEGYFTLPRDHEVIARMLERVRLFPSDGVRAVITEVLSGCSRLTSPLAIAFVGQEGGFGQLAAVRQFGSSATLRSFDTADEALSAVERGHVSYAMLPFETSHDGAVTASLNLLARSDMKICAEVRIRRAFHLLSLSGERDRVKKVYAPASAIAACERYLRERFPDAVVIDVQNGLVAAQHAREDATAAALATDIVADRAGLAYVDRSIEDLADLETRYVAVGKDFPPRTGRDRTAVGLALHDAPGVLAECLKPFAERKLNIYRLETRPARGWAFRYLILLEVDGHITDRAVLAAIEELRTSSRYVKVLGSYPISEG